MKHSIARFTIGITFCCLMFLFPTQASAQCALSYSDVSSDGVYLDGWSELYDYYNNNYGDQCYGFPSFVHYYYSWVEITSPSYRSNSATSGSESVNGGGYSSAYASLLIDGDMGDYQVNTQETIDCSVYGAGFYSASIPIGPINLSIHTFTYGVGGLEYQGHRDYERCNTDSHNYCEVMVTTKDPYTYWPAFLSISVIRGGNYFGGLCWGVGKTQEPYCVADAAP